MAYLLILRRNQDCELPLSPDQMREQFVRWTLSLQRAGVLRAIERLKPAAEGTTLRLRDGELAVEGRYPSPEDFIGYYLIDVTAPADARAFAEECPILAAGGSVEIRETEPFVAE